MTQQSKLYQITGLKGIDDLKSLYAFHGNSQGDDSVSNSIERYNESGGWMSFTFDCEMNDESISKEIEFRKQFNEEYIEKLKKQGEYGKPYFINCHIELDPLFDTPDPKIYSGPSESYKMDIIDFSKL